MRAARIEKPNVNTVLLTLVLTALTARVTPAPCQVTVFPRYGAYVPTPQLHGPGLLLGGSGASDTPDAALAWLHRRLLGDAAHRGGNVVILRASYANIDDEHFYRAGNFASVQTVRIPPCASRAQVDAVAPVVARADAVYFAGGDQAHYVAWKGSALIAAVKAVYARGGGVGGGSAGLAIQGAVVYDSVAADRLGADTTTADAVEDPLEDRISFTTGLFAWPALADTVADTHFVVRDRMGRTIAFLARIFYAHLLPHAGQIYALGVDAGSSVVVDPDGMATVFNSDGGSGAYLIRTDTPPRLVPGEPLHCTVEVARLARNGERFDLLHKQPGEPWYTVTVNGAHMPPYNADPYRP